MGPCGIAPPGLEGASSLYVATMKRLPTVLSTDPKSLPGRDNSCVRVALDVPLPRLFDYAMPAGASAGCGGRVTVPPGHRRPPGGGVAADIPSQGALDRLTAI